MHSAQKSRRQGPAADSSPVPQKPGMEDSPMSRTHRHIFGSRTARRGLSTDSTPVNSPTDFGSIHAVTSSTSGTGVSGQLTRRTPGPPQRHVGHQRNLGGCRWAEIAPPTTRPGGAARSAATPRHSHWLRLPRGRRHRTLSEDSEAPPRVPGHRCVRNYAGAEEARTPGHGGSAEAAARRALPRR